MRLPRRVPWSSLAELEQLCASIYTDENDIESKIFAINRISAWKAITPLPQALESTLAILVVIVHDKKQIFLSTLLLRQSYASAILRLVNGLVDPLQVGTYARPITAIAQQLGIPNWLVELRHAATHEDLPSLDLLREAARQSMSWLLHNYFLPTINPIVNTQPFSDSARPLLPMLKLYKNTMKTITRDASLVSQYKPKLVSIMKELERWIAETKVAANISSWEIGWIGQPPLEATSLEADVKEIWALERFCDVLAEKGILVPLSKKKRQPSLDSFLPGKTSIALWDPLLKHVQAIHPDFSYVLCRRFSSILLACNSANEVTQTSDNKSDPSYEEYTACWVMWIIETWRDDLSAYLDLKRYVLSILMKGLGYESTALFRRSAIFALLKKISAGQVELELMTNFLLDPQPRHNSAWDSEDLDVMKERHDILQSYQSSRTIVTAVAVAENEDEAHEISIPGWRTLKKNTWKQCPIGVYIDTR